MSESNSTQLFTGTSIVVAIVVGAMMVSGWRAGSLDNDVEWIFWAGAILGAVGIGLFGIETAWPRLQLTRPGMVLFLLAPVLCVFAIMADYWI
jgi:hypothetical protein